MKGMLILADAATFHPDGTTSMLRAGIDQVKAAAAPIFLRAALVARIEGELGERGRHELEISCINEDGQDQLPAVKGQFEVPPGGGKHTLVLAIQAKLNTFGLCQFNLLVDKVLLNSWNLRVEQLSEKDNVANND